MNLNFLGASLILAGFLNNAQGIAQVVSFHHAPASVQDTAVQTTRYNFDVERSIRQHRQIVDQSKQQVTRVQERQMTVLGVHDGTAFQASVHYTRCGTRIAAERRRKVDSLHAVQGNTYLITRDPKAPAKLLIQKEGEAALTEPEQTLLENQFETFGKPNPLAVFLHGKRIEVGESLEVPEEVARELLGITGREGKTEPMTLKLARLRIEKGTTLAVFETRLRTHRSESSINMLMKGELEINPATCRTHACQLEGPVAMSEFRGPSQARFAVTTNGSLRVSVKNQRQLRMASDSHSMRR